MEEQELKRDDIESNIGENNKEKKERKGKEKDERGDEREKIKVGKQKKNNKITPYYHNNKADFEPWDEGNIVNFGTKIPIAPSSFGSPLDAYTSALIKGPLSSNNNIDMSVRGIRSMLRTLGEDKINARLIKELSKETVLFIALLGLSGFAAYYYGPEAIKAWEGIFKPIFRIPEDASDASNIPGFFMMFCSGVVNAAVTKITLDSMVATFRERPSPERIFLTSKLGETWADKGRKHARLFFNIILALATVLFGMYLTYLDTTFLSGALLLLWSAWVGLTNLGPNFVGVQSMPLDPRSLSIMEKIKKVTVKHLERQGDELLKLASRDVRAVVEMIDQIQAKRLSETGSSTLERTAFANLLTMFELGPIKNERLIAASRRVGGIAIGASPIGYVWDGYRAGAELNEATGIAVALLSALPLIGLGYLAGLKVGENIFSDKKKLSEIVYPRMQKVVKGIVFIISSGSGGPNTKANSQIELIDKIPGPSYVRSAVRVFCGAVGYGGSFVTNLYFFELLFDYLMIYFATHVSKDPYVIKLIHFMVEFRKAQGLLEVTTTPNFYGMLGEILAQDDALSRAVAGIICSSKDISLKEYADLQSEFPNLPKRKAEDFADINPGRSMLTMMGLKKEEGVGSSSGSPATETSALLLADQSSGNPPARPSGAFSYTGSTGT